MQPKPCPELSTPEAVERLGRMPGFLRDVAGRLQDDQQRWKPCGDDFSLLEHVCHLRDLEQEGYKVRIERILREDRPSLPDFDGAQVARERNYLHESLPRALESFGAARAHNLEFVSNLTAAQLGRIGLLDPAGEVTIEGLLAMMYAHDEEHREQIAELQKGLSSVRQTTD
jgi:hypothetical protein